MPPLPSIEPDFPQRRHRKAEAIIVRERRSAAYTAGDFLAALHSTIGIHEQHLYRPAACSAGVISGGANIYPAEIEAELHKLPGVADCAVFGVPNEDLGEEGAEDERRGPEREASSEEGRGRKRRRRRRKPTGGGESGEGSPAATE